MSTGVLRVFALEHIDKSFGTDSFEARTLLLNYHKQYNM